MIYCEEKLNGTVPNGTSCFAKGKVIWLNKDQIMSEFIDYSLLFEQSLDEGKLIPLKKEIILKLTKKGFVFYPDSVFRYTMHGKKLKEFGVNFQSIK